MLPLNDIYNEDCLITMKKIEDKTIDLIIADPPYFEIYGEFDFVWQNQEDYLTWCKKWIIECKRILKNTGTIYIWGKIGFGKGYSLFKLCDWIEEQKLFLVQSWITQKNCRGRGNRKSYMNAREELVHLTKSKEYTWNPIYLSESVNRKDLGFDGKPRRNTHKRCSDVWIDITEASQSSKERFKTSIGHSFPTVKSIKLCNRIITSSSNPDDVVYIPFAGSGSEIVSCLCNQRHWIASEINSEYVKDIILPRIEKEKCVRI